MIEQFDVVVAGAGPGGMAAATVAAEGGRKVCLIDDQAASGGQIWRGYEKPTDVVLPHRGAYLRWVRRLHASGCLQWNEARVIAKTGRNQIRIERRGDAVDVYYSKLIIATGARERFLPFPGWTLPGVMGVGGTQAFVKAGLEARGKRVVVAGSGPLLLAVASGLVREGADVVLIAEQAPRERMVSFGMHLLQHHPGKLVEGAEYRWRTRNTPYEFDSWVIKAEGKEWLERVTVRVKGKEESFACDWLACAYHLVPNLELPELLGCSIEHGYVVVDDVQRSSVEDVACAGEITGVGGMEKAIVEGQIAGYHAVGRTTEAYELMTEAKRLRALGALIDRAFAPRSEVKSLAGPETIVCRCEDVTRAQLETCDSWRGAKLHTRCGMGACQGRICGAATEVIFGWSATSARPPVMPSRVGSLGDVEEIKASEGESSPR